LAAPLFDIDRTLEHQPYHSPLLQGSPRGASTQTTNIDEMKRGRNWCNPPVPHLALPRFPQSCPILKKDTLCELVFTSWLIILRPCHLLNHLLVIDRVLLVRFKYKYCQPLVRLDPRQTD
jgi:hypothetical protein